MAKTTKEETAPVAGTIVSIKDNEGRVLNVAELLADMQSIQLRLILFLRCP